MNYRQDPIDFELEKNIKRERQTLNAAFSKNFETQSKTLEKLLDGLRYADFNKFNDTKVIWNLAGFINIISFDLKIIGRDLFLAETQWEKRYYARQASLLIYEAINDLFDLLGKDFKLILINKLETKEIDNTLLEVRTDLNLYKSKYFDTLKEIRNNSIAHRESDIFKQISIIINLSWSESVDIVSNFDMILNKLGAVMQKVINQGLKDLEELRK